MPSDRPRPRRGRAAGGVPRAGAHRLPARGPAAEDALPRRRRGARSSELAAQTRRTSSRWSASPSAPRTSTTPPRCWPTARVAGRLPQDVPARTTASSTSSATSRRAPRPALIELNGVTARPHDLRGHLGARAAGHDRGAGGRAGDREPLRLAVPRAARALERERMLVQRARDNLAAVVFCNTVGGQDELVFDGHSVAIDPDGELLARAPAVRGGARRLHDRPARRGRARACATPATGAAVRRQRERWPTAGRARWRAELSPEPRRAEVGGDRGRAARARGARSTRRCAPGCATTWRRTASSAWCSALSGGIDSALVALIAVDALGPERVTCVSMPSPYSSRGHARRRPRDRREPRHASSSSCRSSDAMEAYDELLRRAVRGHRARHHRGEHPGAHPRQRGDGAVEQVRLARAHHRQQVASCRSATRRSTATWPAASRC